MGNRQLPIALQRHTSEISSNTHRPAHPYEPSSSPTLSCCGPLPFRFQDILFPASSELLNFRSTCHSIGVARLGEVQLQRLPLHCTPLSQVGTYLFQCSLHGSSPCRLRHVWAPHLHSTSPSVSDNQISCREHGTRARNHCQDWVPHGHTPPPNRHLSCPLVAGAVCNAIEPHLQLQNCGRNYNANCYQIPDNIGTLSNTPPYTQPKPTWTPRGQQIITCSRAAHQDRATTHGQQHLQNDIEF